MPWTGNGVFSRIYSWVADKAAGIDISSTRMDTDTNDIVTAGLGNCITRDGQGQPTANLPMAGFRHINAANGVNSSDYATLGQAQNSLSNWVTAGGSADAITAAYQPAVGALADGQLFFVRASAANATINPTFSPNGLGPYTITKNGGAVLGAGDIRGAAAELILRYNVGGRMELLNPAGAALITGMVMPYAGGDTPAGWVLAQGQALARVGSAAALFALISTIYGAGDGSTTFNVPNLVGRVPAGAGASGLSGIGVVVGGVTQTLVAGNLPAYTPSGTVTNGAITNGAISINVNGLFVGAGTFSFAGGGANNTPTTATGITNPTQAATTQAASSFAGNAQGGSSTAFSIMQPTLGVSYLIKL